MARIVRCARPKRVGYAQGVGVQCDGVRIEDETTETIGIVVWRTPVNCCKKCKRDG